MNWDSSRPVPWKRLGVEWAFIAAVAAVVSFSTTGNRSFSSYLVLVLGGGAVYFTVGAAMARLGYQRRTLQRLTDVAASPRRTVGRTPNAAASNATPRPRPAPTKRTSGGPGHRPQKRRR